MYQIKRSKNNIFSPLFSASSSFFLHFSNIWKQKLIQISLVGDKLVFGHIANILREVLVPSFDVTSEKCSRQTK